MSEQPPYPPSDPNQPGWGQQPPAGPPGWGQQPPGPPPGGRGFAATDAIGYGWKAFTSHTGALLGAALIVLLVPIAIQVVSALTTGGQTFSFTADSSGGGFDLDFDPMALVLNLVSSIISLILSAAMVRLALDVVDGQQVSIGAMFSRFDLVQVLIAAVVLSIATTIGLALCVLPGLVVLFLTFLTNYFIVGKGQDAFTAIRSSVSLTTAHVGELLLLALLCFLCMLGGAIACGVGLLVAFPVITVATAFAFRALQGEQVRPY